MSERNKVIARRAFDEVYNQGNLELVDELVSSDFVAHVASEDIHGPAGMKQFVTSLREAFPDLHIAIDDQVAEGDRVVTRWTARGTHAGPFQGVPPTGRQGIMTGIDIDRVIDGKAVECWTTADYLGLMQQLGVVPAPGQEDGERNTAAVGSHSTRMGRDRARIRRDRDTVAHGIGEPGSRPHRHPTWNTVS